MVLLLNSAGSECSVSYLYRPRISFQVIYHHYTFRLCSAVMRIGIRMNEFGKCSARIVLLKEIREETLFASTAPIGVSISILWRLPWSWRVRGWVYILQERPRAVSGKTFTFLSKFFVWGFSAVIIGDKYICMSQLYSVLCTGPSLALLMLVQKRMAVRVWQVLLPPSVKQGSRSY